MSRETSQCLGICQTTLCGPVWSNLIAFTKCICRNFNIGLDIEIIIIKMEGILLFHPIHFYSFYFFSIAFYVVILIKVTIELVVDFLDGTAFLTVGILFTDYWTITRNKNRRFSTFSSCLLDFRWTFRRLYLSATFYLRTILKGISKKYLQNLNNIPTKLTSIVSRVSKIYTQGNF